MMDSSGFKFQSRCNLYSSGLDTIIMENKGQMSSLEVNRTWEEYKFGFQTDRTWWMGLENLRQLILSTAEIDVLKVVVRFSNGTHLVTRRVHHENFQLSNETSGYSFTFSGTRLTSSQNKTFLSHDIPNDCLTPQNGSMFSTWDRDSDTNPDENCAKLAGSGWWYLDCNESCNPLLPFYQEDEIGQDRYDRVRLPGADLRDNHDKLDWIHINIFEYM